MTTRAYELDGFSQLTMRFARMMKESGHTVILYAGSLNEAPCDELVPVISKAEIETAHGSTPYQDMRIEAAAPLIQLTNPRIIEGIAARKQPRDLICSLGGTAQAAVAAAHPELQFVEYSIGYPGSFGPYRVFESVAWKHFTYGAQRIEDVRYFDTVIPVPFDPAEFPFRQVKEPFLLYVGRLTERKGLNIVAATAAAAKIPLKVIGHGDLKLIPAGAEYLGALPTAERNDWMSRAQAVICPTIFVEPFNQVACEAQLAGSAVISTDAGGFCETVIHGVTGFRCNVLSEFVAAVDACRGLDPYAIRQSAVKRYSMHVLKSEYQSYFERLATLWRAGWYEP